MLLQRPAGRTLYRQDREETGLERPCTSQESRVHVVVTSTTSPGECDATLVPALDAITGRKAGIDHGFSYNPEFIALGSVVANMRKPDFVLIGSAAQRHAVELRQFYQGVYSALVETWPRFALMNLLTAEISKLAVNCYTTMKISYANQLGTLCEALPGADAHVVCRAIGMDSRIGTKYLCPATTFSGPCLPRDNRAMLEAVRRAGGEAPLCHATTAVNEQQWQKIERLILSAKPQNLAFLGLSYKPDTAVTEESMAERIIGRFAPVATYPILVHDPLAKTAHPVTQCRSARDAVRGADVVLIATDHPEYRLMERHWFLRSALIIDCWDVLGQNPQFDGARRWVPGKGATWIA